MTQHEIESIVDTALHAAIASIQAAVGQPDGGFAALWFTGQREAVRERERGPDPGGHEGEGD